MACDKEFIDFVCDQIEGCGNIRSKAMFGEYMIYVNDKPIFLVCDNRVFVKKLDCTEDIMSSSETDIPYNGAKEHYVLDIDNRELCQMVVNTLEPITKVPRKRAKKQ